MDKVNVIRADHENLKGIDRKVFARIRNEEDQISNGIFAVPFSTRTPRVKMRAMLNYCKKVGKEPNELSEIEREFFWDK